MAPLFKIWGSGVELMPLTVKDARKRMNKEDPAETVGAASVAQSLTVTHSANVH